MDKIIRITSGLLIVILVLFVSITAYTVFVETAYRGSLVSTYSYSCTISTDAVLRNVTLFIPIPADNRGNSPVVERYSVRDIQGLPSDWKTTLIGSNKGTVVQIQAPVIAPAGNATSSRVSGYELILEAKVARLIDTRTPLVSDAVFRPMPDLKKVDCPDPSSGGSCYNYQSAIYADYSTSPNARVSIDSEIVGRNDWKIFKPAFNEYRASISMLNFGENHGWVVAKGFMRVGIGAYDAPVLKA